MCYIATKDSIFIFFFLFIHKFTVVGCSSFLFCIITSVWSSVMPFPWLWLITCITITTLPFSSMCFSFIVIIIMFRLKRNTFSITASQLKASITSILTTWNDFLKYQRIRPFVLTVYATWHHSSSKHRVTTIQHLIKM
jgi:hypothetical protein